MSTEQAAVAQAAAEITFIGYKLSIYLCYLVGILYPAYKSFKALETKVFLKFSKISRTPSKMTNNG
jgi:hypothetical protein